ncbi:sensor histidine kinase [Aerococcus sanguinicola]|uniref:histidine kinase n=1 Tax=Aerococcus sanguinicola TaxID=119206 RepID=A0A120I9B1_9LACT|nr:MULTISPECIES: HAMP domain-containing sensor histidine kinase [Aerococcus]AMB94358.1 histidine kinase [Aerococcus sanguinicola]OFT93475.1 two-component sensor histidine kinase [Aerococcus sp. HMSC23C02]PKZ20681.1 sensor histidine kinase [Aerococcus sanguinicola]
MERKLNFQGHIEKTVWRIIWQFGLSIILAYLVPLVFLSIEIHSNSYSFNREVLNIFFNVFSWMYACTMLVIIISINLTKLLKIVKQDMDIVYHQSLWLNHNPRSWDIQIAEFSQTNRHIEAMQERIERMVQAEKKQKKDVLFKVSAMAHDLKTPLTVIQGNAELLQFSIQSNQNYQCLKDIEKASQQLDDYFNQLISYAKMSYTKPIYFSDYSVENLAKVIKDECAYLIGKTITYHLSEDLKEGYTVHVDMDLIIRSVDNIINNAISYGSKPNQEIRLYIVADARHLRIIIWNRGAGFSEEVLENFGSLFYKADSSRSHKNQHFGIGLAFVKQVMVLHAGYIQLQNINQGARVELAIPVYEKG